MQARMTNPVFLVPEAMQALQAFSKAVHKGAVPQRTLELINLRVSQINGCSVCVEMHAADLKRSGESDVRIIAATAWRELNSIDPDRGHQDRARQLASRLIPLSLRATRSIRIGTMYVVLDRRCTYFSRGQWMVDRRSSQLLVAGSWHGKAGHRRPAPSSY